jgi:RNA polymerase sigma-70 factor (ECF subfamily)
MKLPEPEGSEPQAGRFHTTCWDDILAARDSASPEAREALAQLCRAYWYPLYAYVRRKGYPREQAEDLTQGFFSDGLARHSLRAVDPDRGRFRSFLLTSFENHQKNEHQRQKRVKRGGRIKTVSIDTGDAEARYHREPAHIATAERLYDRRWALTVLDRALDRLERRMADRGQRPLFDRLKAALLGDSDAVAYARVASELGLTEGAVKVAAHRLRERLRDLIREEIATTVADPAQIDDEIRDLFSALGS